MSEQVTLHAQREKPKAPAFADMVRLMRLETERAQRHGYPISCLLVDVDGSDSPAELPQRTSLMRAVFGELKVAAFRDQMQGLGAWTPHHLIAVFPHYAPERVGALAEVLRGRIGARLRELDGAAHTISAGVAHNQHPGPMSFEILVQEAETGLGMARTSGGDRCMQWRDVETELDRLRDELERQIGEVREQQQALRDDPCEIWGQELIDKLLAAFDGEREPSPGVVRLERDVIALVHSELDRFKAGPLGQELVERTRQVDLLERRIKKLTDLLAVTEQELKRVASMKDFDPGRPSIYRTVQGLSFEVDNAETKLELMKSIFESNLALKRGAR